MFLKQLLDGHRSFSSFVHCVVHTSEPTLPDDFMDFVVFHVNGAVFPTLGHTGFNRRHRICLNVFVVLVNHGYNIVTKFERTAVLPQNNGFRQREEQSASKLT